MKNRLLRAFTLLEILVVIGIIAILVSLGAVSYSTAQKKSRDAKRKSDLKAIQNALEQYYSICGYVYPTPDTGNKVPTSIGCASPSTTFMSLVPTDPKTGVAYDMTQTATSDYSICTTPVAGKALETESLTTYCITNQQ